MTTTTRARPAALILTPSAEDRIAALMAKAPEGAIGVKLSTPKRGCSGLAYSVDYVTEAGHAVVTMTLTTPHCPVAESMPMEVEMRVGAVPGIGSSEVNLVWDPAWDPAKMSDDAKLELGML